MIKFDIMLFKNNVTDFFTNPVLLCAIFAWLAAQILKLFTTPYYVKEFSFLQVMFGSGGMPSSHSSTVTALAVSSYLLYGASSSEFAISFILFSIF